MAHDTRTTPEHAAPMPAIAVNVITIDPLIAVLRRLRAELNAAKDPKARLEIGLHTIRATIEFLNKDRRVIDEQLTAPYAMLENALLDASLGAHAPLLDHPPGDPKRKPAKTSRESVQGRIAFAIALAKGSGKSTSAAAGMAASWARQLSVRCSDGSPITPIALQGGGPISVRGRHPRKPAKRLRT